MAFLDNTKKGFNQEMAITFGVSAILSFLVIFFSDHLNPSYRNRSLQDILIIYPLMLIVVGSIVREIRWSIVYKTPVFLYFISLEALIGIFIGINLLQKSDFINRIAGLITIGFVGLYFLSLIYIKIKNIFKNPTPGYRIQMLKLILSWNQRLTLIIPENIMKYLDTGNEKYIQGEKLKDLKAKHILLNLRK